MENFKRMKKLNRGDVSPEQATIILREITDLIEPMRGQLNTLLNTALIKVEEMYITNLSDMSDRPMEKAIYIAALMTAVQRQIVQHFDKELIDWDSIGLDIIKETIDIFAYYYTTTVENDWHNSYQAKIYRSHRLDSAEVATIEEYFGEQAIPQMKNYLGWWGSVEEFECPDDCTMEQIIYLPVCEGTSGFLFFRKAK